MEQAYLKAYPSLWAMKYKTIRGAPTTFTSKDNPHKNRPFQTAILDDFHKNIVVEKSRQLGLSEVGLTEVLHFLTTHNKVNAMYIFPRDSLMADFSKSRITPCLEDSKYLASMVDKTANSVSTKNINGNYLFLRSGWSGALGEGTDLDYLAIDEYDRMKPNIEVAFQEGLSSSTHGYLRRWSTPTIPGRGVNHLFSKSDQRRYFHTCPKCGHQQYLTFEDNVIQVKPHGVNKVSKEIEDGTFIIGCKKCKAELNRWQPGSWVAMEPHIRESRGYHISQLDATWITADSIMRKFFSYNSKQLFYNYVVGEPYASEGLIVTEADLKSAVRLPREVMSRTQNYSAIVAGIDWGAVSYMVVVGVKSNGVCDLLNIFTVEDDPRVPLRSASMFSAILRAYRPNLVVCDAGYGADRNAYMYTQFPTSLYSCSWTTSKDANSKVRFKDLWNEKQREVSVDKTVAIQRVLHTLKNQLLGLFPWDEKLEMLTLHVKNTRIMDEESDGKIYQKATRIGPDHTVSALAYALIGVQKLTNYNIAINNPLSYDFI